MKLDLGWDPNHVNEAIIGPYNGLSSTQHQTIIWTNAGLLLLDPCEQISVIC